MSLDFDTGIYRQRWQVFESDILSNFTTSRKESLNIFNMKALLYSPLLESDMKLGMATLWGHLLPIKQKNQHFQQID